MEWIALNIPFAIRKSLIIAALVWSGYGSPVWCDSCGEICESLEPPIETYTDHHGVEHTGPLCEYCETYWFEMEDSLRDS